MLPTTVDVSIIVKTWPQTLRFSASRTRLRIFAFNGSKRVMTFAVACNAKSRSSVCRSFSAEEAEKTLALGTAAAANAGNKTSRISGPDEAAADRFKAGALSAGVMGAPTKAARSATCELGFPTGVTAPDG